MAQHGGGSRIDPYYLEFFGAPPRGYGNTAGRLLLDPRTWIAIGTPAKTFLIAGQSLGANTGTGTLYTSIYGAGGRCFNFNIIDGGIYSQQDPMLGCDGDGRSWLGILGDVAVPDISSHSLLVPISLGGTEIARWQPGGVLHHRFGVAVNRLSDLGISIDYVIWEQGQTDNAAGTTKAAYKAALSAIITSLRGMGVSCPILINKSTWYLGAVSTAIQDAQTETVDNVNGIYAGADFDSLDNTYRHDTTHFNEAGTTAAADLMKAAILAI